MVDLEGFGEVECFELVHKLSTTSEKWGNRVEVKLICINIIL